MAKQIPSRKSAGADIQPDPSYVDRMLAEEEAKNQSKNLSNNKKDAVIEAVDQERIIAPTQARSYVVEASPKYTPPITGYTYFVWLNNTNASYSFTGYTDRNGEMRAIITGHDSRGVPLMRRFRFSRDRRILSIPNTQKDVIEFLRNSPECHGSQNGHYRDSGEGKLAQLGVVFKELNSGKDAEIAISAIENKAEATSLALKYKEAIISADSEKLQELGDLAILCGTFESDPRLQLHHILQYAENSPTRFIEIYNDPSRTVRALVNAGLNGKNPFLRRRGFMIYWENIHLGNDVDQVIQYLLKSQDVFLAMRDAYKRTK